MQVMGLADRLCPKNAHLTSPNFSSDDESFHLICALKTAGRTALGDHSLHLPRHHFGIALPVRASRLLLTDASGCCSSVIRRSSLSCCSIIQHSTFKKAPMTLSPSHLGQTAPQWRQFTFFDAENVKDEQDMAQSPRAIRVSGRPAYSPKPYADNR